MKSRLKTRAFLSIPHFLLNKRSRKRETGLVDHNDNEEPDDDCDGSLGDYGIWGGSMYDLRRAQSDLRVDRRPSATSAASFRSEKVSSASKFEDLFIAVG